MEGWKQSEKQPLPVLYERFLGGMVEAASPADTSPAAMNAKPLDLEGVHPMPSRLRLYVFNATDHPSERKAGDYRIQLRLPGQKRRQRGRLCMEHGVLVLLAGYVAEFDVFVMWDSVAHAEFPYSKGVQVGGETVHHAAIYGIAEQDRTTRGQGGYAERVVAARTDHLIEGIERRLKLTSQSLLSATRGNAQQ